MHMANHIKKKGSQKEKKNTDLFNNMLYEYPFDLWIFLMQV